MLIDDKLPIDINHLLKQDRTLSFSGMTWKDYENYSPKIVSLIYLKVNLEVLEILLNYLKLLFDYFLDNIL